jgi:hypothetical protein
MFRRIVAIAIVLVVGASSVEVLLPGETRATSTTEASTQGSARADCACLCACGCTHALVVVLADALVPLPPSLTHSEALQGPAVVVATVDPVPQFRPPRA